MIADDFTGAMDTGVQFSARGAVTQVVPGPDADWSRTSPEVEVLVVDAETRHLPPAQAGRIVGNIVSQALRLGVPCLYKKTDSALRGNIGAELEAVMKAAGIRQLPFLPAFPRLGRVTRNGRHYIDGVPVDQSVFGRDPFNPVRHAEVAALIREQSSVPVFSLPAGGTSLESGICVYDAASDEDLRRTGILLRQSGGLSVSAGCAGFGAVLADLLDLAGDPPPLPRLTGPLLVLCGSVNPITLRQLQVAEENGFVRLTLQPAEKLTPGYLEQPEGRELLARMRRLLRQHSCLIVDTSDPDGTDCTRRSPEARGLSSEEIRIRISRCLGAVMASLSEDPAFGTLLITGGDTLLACVKASGIADLEPLGELFPSVVLSRFSHHGQPRLVISKSGGFGEPDLLVKIAACLSQDQASEP